MKLYDAVAVGEEFRGDMKVHLALRHDCMLFAIGFVGHERVQKRLIGQCYYRGGCRQSLHRHQLRRGTAERRGPADRGRDWHERTGVRIEGVCEAMPAEHPDLREPMSAWHEKYRGAFAGEGFERFARAVPVRGFLRLVPSTIEAWDHRREALR